MASEDKDGQGLPLFVFIPLILCIVGILVLLDIRQRQRNPPHVPINTQPQAFEQQFLHDRDDQDDGEQDASDDNHDEGSSSAVRVKKVGKKRGDKLRKKEEKRRYREYMDQQRDLRRAQEEADEEEYRRIKMEQSIQRTDEMEKRRKEREKLAKAKAKEELKMQALQEKDAKKRQYRFNKYSDKLKKLVKEKKLCDTHALAKSMGLSQEEVIDMLKQSCDQDDEFELCLWSGTDTFLFITREDYEHFNEQFSSRGKQSIHDATL
ncbi:uncharacterized protein ATC70_008421 [Mucor velutinosus]|uniref:DDRGK domain-containing protein 1 n=1 Tax=Mucor velutinosus TaxID=708070 RepID=A0AAN7DP89_9FUNG|nr:hypothetical protein ATC70_008421 [Mucor velutinosus]